jgi:ferric-dicitrate binding protein FerR (iron transport regulator)
MRSIETDELTASTLPGPKLTTISEEAADWFLRARDRQFTPNEQKALARWFKQSPQHIAEFIRVYQLHGLLREAKLEPFEPGPQALAPEHCSPRDRLRRDRRRISWAVLLLLGIGVVFLVVLLVVLLGGRES